MKKKKKKSKIKLTKKSNLIPREISPELKQYLDTAIKDYKQYPDEVFKSVDYIDNKTQRRIVDHFLYVSNYGQLIFYSEKFKKFIVRELVTQNIGYAIVRVNGIWRTAHRVIAHMFVPFPKCTNIKKLEIDHIDRNRVNNKASNLRWITRSANLQRREKRMTFEETAKNFQEKKQIAGYYSSAKAVIVLDIYGNKVNEFQSITQASLSAHANWRMIADCVHGKIAIFRGFIWMSPNDDVEKRLEMLKELSAKELLRQKRMAKKMDVSLIK